MTWSLYYSGDKEAASQAIDNAASQYKDMPAAELKAIVATLPGNAVHISASGHASEFGGNISLNIGSHMRAA